MPGSSSLFESRARRSANFVFRLHFFGEICAPKQCSQPPSYITSLSAKTRRPRNNPLLVFSFCSALNLLDIETRRTTHLNQPPTVGNTGFVPCAREKCPKTWQDLPMQRCENPSRFGCNNSVVRRPTQTFTSQTRRRLLSKLAQYGVAPKMLPLGNFAGVSF